MLKSNKNASVKCLHTVFHCFWQCGYLLHYITWKQYISCPQTQNVGHKFYYFASAAYAASEAYVFVLSVAVSVPSSIPSSFHPMPNIFLLFHKNTEQISIKYAGGNHCHKQIKWLHFWGNRNRIREKSESMLIGFAAMSNRCWCLANEFTNVTVQTTADAITYTI